MELLQVLVALACDLGLDSMPLCSDSHKWLWFRRYCTASRASTSLIQRSPLPPTFCEEVCKKIREMCAEEENISNEHEDHSVFQQEHDEQLILWVNRQVLFLIIIYCVHFFNECKAKLCDIVTVVFINVASKMLEVLLDIMLLNYESYFYFHQSYNENYCSYLILLFNSLFSWIYI